MQSPPIAMHMYSTYPDIMYMHKGFSNNGCMATEQESKFCYAQFCCSPDYVIPEVHYVYVIDTSGSMQGLRIHNAKLGLKASCMYLPEDTDISILSFNDYARVLHQGKNPYKGHADLNMLENGLQPYGGTSISKALELTLDHIESVFQNSKDKSIVVLFMTDGEDPNFADYLKESKQEKMDDSKNTLLSRMMGLSGVFTNFVGISTDAASADMAFLAEVSNGTFVSVNHNDIVDIMGSMLGLCKERVPHKITVHLEAKLSLKPDALEDHQEFFAKLQTIAPETFAMHHVLEECKFVPIRTSAPTKLFFELREFHFAFTKFPAIYESVQVTASVKIFQFGTVSLESTELVFAQNWKLIPFPNTTDFPTLNYECIFLNIQKIWGSLNAKCAELIKDGFYKESLQQMHALLSFWKQTWITFYLEQEDPAKLQNMSFVLSRVDMESIGKKIEDCIKAMEDAEASQNEMDNLHCRMLSNAATDRNFSMTLESLEEEDDLSLQVQTRNSIRQLSQSF